jgi:RNA polymerase sigma factor (sigma-70 family)
MTEAALAALKRDLVRGNSVQLKEIYLLYKQDVVNILVFKNYATQIEAEDVFTDALMVFRHNVITGRITMLSSVKAYLTSTCINMIKEKWHYEKRKKKKEDEVRLLFYEKNHNTPESNENKERLEKLALEALKKLPEKCQRIIIAFYIYKLTMKEIAEDLGFSNADVAKSTKLRCYKSWIKELNLLKQK